MRGRSAAASERATLAAACRRLPGEDEAFDRDRGTVPGVLRKEADGALREALR